MTKFTPGPWTTQGGFSDDISSEAGNLLVASVYGGHWDDGSQDICLNEEQRANARLIAAAPELLAALEAADEWLDDNTPKDIQQQIFAAIVKAQEGQ